MEETIGWLLPILLAVSLVKAISSAEDQRRVRTSCLIAMGILLAGTSIWLIQRPAIDWAGPTIFALDSFHQIQFRLQLTLAELPLLWVVWWWMADESPDAAVESTNHRSLRQTVLSCLLLMLLADNLWLWFGSLVAFSLFQQVLGTRSASQDFRWTTLRGFHWLGVLLLLIGIGILTFEFPWQNFSQLSEVFENWDAFSEAQHAELILATTLASWSVLLMAAVFPISVLRIDRDDESGIEILGVIVAGAVCLQFLPLISMVNVTAAHRSLLLLTVVAATVCSWQQPTTQRSMRCLGTAFLMLGLLGLLMNGADDFGQLCRLQGLQHLALAIVLWKICESAPKGSRETLPRKMIFGCVSAILLLGMTGWPLMVEPSVSALYGSIAVEFFPPLIAGGLSFGLIEVSLAAFQKRPASADFETPLSQSKTSRTRWFEGELIIFVPLFAILFVCQSLLEDAGLPGSIFPSLGLLAGVVMGGFLALLVVLRPSKSDTVVKPSGAFFRLLESQFHLVTIWQGVVQAPGIILATVLNLWEIRRLRSIVRTSQSRNSARNETTFVWEFGLGLASLIVLSCLFLWMGE